MKPLSFKLNIAVLLLLASASAKAQTAVPNIIHERYGSYCLIGDSYSTFMGFTDPLDNAQYYPRANSDVVTVNDTWWKKFGNDCNITLVQNNSYSGSIMCTHGWDGNVDMTSSFVGRIDNLREAGVIIVEGATNDNSAGVGMGEYVYSDFTSDQLYTFRGGVAYILDFLLNKYPNSQVVFMLNSGLSTNINTSVETICNHYNVPLYKLVDITKTSDHPDKSGMKNIAFQLEQFLCELNGYHYIDEGQTISIDADADNQNIMVGKVLRKNQWNSLCLPFDMSADAIEATFGEGTSVQTIDSFSDGVAHFKKVSTIEAQHPYIIKPTIAIDHDFSLSGVTLQKGDPTVVEASTECTMYGIYSQASYKRGVNYYGVAYNGTLYQISSQSDMPGALCAVIECTEEVNSMVLEGEDLLLLPTISADSDIFTPVVKNHHLLPATPIVVADPFLSVWSPSENLYDGETKYVSDDNRQLEGYVEVDGTLYRFMGTGDESLESVLEENSAPIEVAQQTYKTVTASQTYYTFTAGNVELTMVFSSPQLITDETTLDAAINYISYKVETLDGQSHDVNVHLAVSKNLATSLDSEPTRKTIDNTEGVSLGKIGSYAQAMSEEILADWGYVIIMADAQRNQSLQQISAYQILSDRMGYTTKSAGYTLIGRDENSAAIGLGYARFPAPWTLYYHTFDEAMVAYARQIEERLEACKDFDLTIYNDALYAGGIVYADMCQNVYRQVIAGIKRALSDSGNALMYNVDPNDTWYINLADQCFASAPLFLTYNPQIAYDLFEATPDYVRQNTGFYSQYGSAPHHLGNWPIMDGSNIDTGVDATTDMCILAGAAVKSGLDPNSIPEESYEYLKSLCDYLDIFTLPAYENSFRNEGSADDNGSMVIDYANLRIKSTLSMELLADIAQARGNATDETTYREMAQRWKDYFISNYATSDHYLQGSNVMWGLKYPLYYDKALGLDLFSDVIDTELAYYKNKAFRDYGLQLDARVSSYAKVHENILTASMSVDEFTVFSEPVFNYLCSYTEERPIADIYNCNTSAGSKGFGSTALGSMWAKVLIDKLLNIPSGIQELPSEKRNNTIESIYDLMGRKISGTPSRGVYIINGRKVVVR